MDKQQATSGDKLREKYQDGLLALLSLQPEFSQPGTDQATPANELQQGGNPVRQESKEPGNQPGVPATTDAYALRSRCVAVYRQYNKLNQHLKALAVNLTHASEETPGESQQFHVDEANKTMSLVIKESRKLRILVTENAYD